MRARAHRYYETLSATRLQARHTCTFVMLSYQRIMSKRKAMAESFSCLLNSRSGSSAAAAAATTADNVDVSAIVDKRSKFLDDIHTHLTCPITNELMVNPVVAEDGNGNTYERSAIEQWIKLKGTSPLNRHQRLSIGRLNLNRSVLTTTTALIESGSCGAALANSWREAKKKAELALIEDHFTLGRVLVAAKLGHSKAQGVMAERYYHGSDGVTKDLKQCLLWAQKAADGGDEGGQFRLAYYFHNGEESLQDKTKALKLYKLVASSPTNSCYAVACNNIGCIYKDSGDASGRRRDYITAAIWFQKGAKAGDDFAQFSLAGLYKHGRGVKKDLAAARSWYRKSAAQMHPESMFELGKMESKGEGGVVEYSSGMRNITESSRLGLKAATDALIVMANAL